jgi:hypothetical protein
MVIALITLFGNARAVGGASAHHRTATEARHKPSHRAVHSRPSPRKHARKAHQAAAPAEAALIRPPRWHPGVDLAFRLSGKRVRRR